MGSGCGQETYIVLLFFARRRRCSRKKPAPERKKRLMAEWQKGDAAWCYINDDVTYEAGKIVELGEDDRSVTLKLASGKTLTTERANVLRANKDKQDGVEDNTFLRELNEATILHNVGVRYAKSEGGIYSTTGHILIAVNPFRQLKIYEEAQARALDAARALPVRPRRGCRSTLRRPALPRRPEHLSPALARSAADQALPGQADRIGAAAHLRHRRPHVPTAAELGRQPGALSPSQPPGATPRRPIAPAVPRSLCPSRAGHHRLWPLRRGQDGDVQAGAEAPRVRDQAPLRGGHVQVVDGARRAPRDDQPAARGVWERRDQPQPQLVALRQVHADPRLEEGRHPRRLDPDLPPRGDPRRRARREELQLPHLLPGETLPLARCTPRARGVALPRHAPPSLLPLSTSEALPPPGASLPTLCPPAAAARSWPASRRARRRPASSRATRTSTRTCATRRARRPRGRAAGWAGAGTPPSSRTRSPCCKRSASRRS